MDLDLKNKKILGALLDNSRLSMREISKKTKISAATVMHRMKEMEDKKIIHKYTAMLDYEKLGYDVDVIIEMQISKGKLFQVEKKIAVHPNVVSVYDVTGDFDAIIIARFRNTRKMDKFLKDIQQYDFVERTQTKLILNKIKEKHIKL